MSLPFINKTPGGGPTYIAGTPRSSGDVQTGEIQFIRGGGRAGTVYSGAAAVAAVCGGPYAPAVAGGEVQFWSGAGRLNALLQHIALTSGLGVTFYDAAVITSGGPFAASGHKIIGIIPPTWPGGSYSGTGLNIWNGAVVNVDMPFQSGLCAHTASGCPGFTVSWTPEVNQNWPNA